MIDDFLHSALPILLTPVITVPHEFVENSSVGFTLLYNRVNQISYTASETR